jgi:hypothetical protein
MGMKMTKSQRTAMFFKQKSHQIAAGVALGTVAASASAAIDVTAVVTVLTDGIAACVSIGVVLLSVWATKKVYSMIKS